MGSERLKLEKHGRCWRAWESRNWNLEMYCTHLAPMEWCTLISFTSILIQALSKTRAQERYSASIISKPFFGPPHLSERIIIHRWRLSPLSLIAEFVSSSVRPPPWSPSPSVHPKDPAWVPQFFPDKGLLLIPPVHRMHSFQWLKMVYYDPS